MDEPFHVAEELLLLCRPCTGCASRIEEIAELLARKRTRQVIRGPLACAHLGFHAHEPHRDSLVPVEGANGALTDPELLKERVVALQGLA